ncbi:hypothetical protein JC221_022 [Yersinia phage JC221]|nr:hypothetical protein JC221_022 [Yersinia phage JC221]
MIEDIKGYKPHTDEKINTVNLIKDAENALGAILDDLDKKYSEAYATGGGLAYEVLDNLLERGHQIRIAKDRLKEASMWACRAVFQPEEKY